MTRIQANLLLTLAAMIWGSSFVVQQIGTGELGTITFTGSRFLIGALIVLPFAGRQVFMPNCHPGGSALLMDISWFIFYL